MPSFPRRNPRPRPPPVRCSPQPRAARVEAAGIFRATAHDAPRAGVRLRRGGGRGGSEVCGCGGRPRAPLSVGLV